MLSQSYRNYCLNILVDRMLWICLHMLTNIPVQFKFLTNRKIKDFRHRHLTFPLPKNTQEGIHNEFLFWKKYITSSACDFRLFQPWHQFNVWYAVWDSKMLCSILNWICSRYTYFPTLNLAPLLGFCYLSKVTLLDSRTASINCS